MPSDELEQVLRHLDRHRPTERTLPNLRRYVDAMGAMEPVAPDVVIEASVASGVPCERVTVPGVDPTKTLLYFHGGGYSLGSPEGYRPLAGKLARAFGGAVVVPDYRRSPEHPFPAGFEDALAVARTFDATRTVLGGDSAGGGLAVATLVALREGGEPLPRGAALLSPWVDLAGTGASLTERASLDPVVSREGMQSLAQLYLGDGDRRDPRASPTHAKLEGLPPLLVQLGTREIQFDDVHAFVDKARSAGVDVTLEDWEGMIHVFQMFPVFSDAARAIDRIGAFLRSRLA
jgi:acetyl esterase/lipase